jgi:hypothetical protein
MIPKQFATFRPFTFPLLFPEAILQWFDRPFSHQFQVNVSNKHSKNITKKNIKCLSLFGGLPLDLCGPTLATARYNNRWNRSADGDCASAAANASATATAADLATALA